jgi:hypothetical protein
MDSVDCQEVHQGYLYGIVSVLVSHVSFSTSFGQQPHSWHVHWLLSVQFVNNVHAQMPMVFHLLSHADIAPIPVHFNVWEMFTRMT